MQSESKSDSLDFDSFLTWLYANRFTVGIAIVIIAVVIGGFSIFNWRKGQKEANANAALFALPPLITPMGKAGDVHADAFEKVANEYPDTAAGERAELIAASILFTNGKYAEAQQQFSKFLTGHEGSALKSQAALGVAASLEAQGKINDAIAQYQDLIAKYSGENVISPAKLTLARLLESQNKPADALKLYDDLARTQNPYDPWAVEASERRELLLQKNPSLRKPVAMAPTATTSAPAVLSPAPTSAAPAK